MLFAALVGCFFALWGANAKQLVAKRTSAMVAHGDPAMRRLMLGIFPAFFTESNSKRQPGRFLLPSCFAFFVGGLLSHFFAVVFYCPIALFLRSP
jgi:hypothetical protein